jgi:BppU N-terminal domain
MATKIRLVEGDTRPRLIFTLKDKDGDVIDISSATILFKMKPLGETALKAEVACTILSGLKDEEDGTIDYTPPYDVAGVGGRIRVDWSSADLDTAGRYEAEIEITYGDGTKQTVYDKISITIRGDMDV